MRTTFFAASLVLAAIVPTTHVAAQSSQDKAIALEIGNQLKSSGQLRDYRIGVKYKEGTAALTGTVANQQQLQAALRLTQQMPGVDQVVNNLTVANTPNNNLKPAAQQAARAAYNRSLGENELATPTAYQQQAPLGPQGQGQFRGPGQMAGQGPMYPQNFQGQPMNRQAMAPQGMNPNMAGYNQTAGYGPRPPQGPSQGMNGGRMPAQARGNMPRPMGRPQVQQAMMDQQRMQAMQAGCNCGPGGMGGGGYSEGMDVGPGAPMGHMAGGMGGAPSYDNAQMPGYAWPSYASYPNYAAISYPQQYSPSAWPYIGPFYPYPQVPLGWRKVCLEWDDGWWFLDFSDCGSNH